MKRLPGFGLYRLDLLALCSAATATRNIIKERTIEFRGEKSTDPCPSNLQLSSLLLTSFRITLRLALEQLQVGHLHFRKWIVFSHSFVVIDMMAIADASQPQSALRTVPRNNTKIYEGVPFEVYTREAVSAYRAPHLRDWVLHGCASSWHPLPPSDAEVEALCVQIGNRMIVDYIGIRNTFHHLVHPADEEVNGTQHTCINLAILPDWILNNDKALYVLDLVPH
jgi:hypothetical protein